MELNRIELTETPYLFQSERLRFRSWSPNDLERFAELNADPMVMKHFPNTLTLGETKDLLDRFQMHFETNGYCYFATEIQETGEFIGFIGLAYQDFEAEFTPATDIGWRLKRSAWGNGYATEGAIRCLQYAFEDLGIDKVISICTMNNNPSEHVMQKIGMQRMGEFKHPKLKKAPEYENCVWYEKMRPNP